MEIIIPLDGVSPTGLKAKELMGLTVNSINDLSDSDAVSFSAFYEELYTRAFRTLQTDAQKILSGFYRYQDGTIISGKFNINKKLGTLETSEFTSDPQGATGQAGVRIVWSPSQYSVASISFVQVYIKTMASPSILTLRIYDNTKNPDINGKIYDKEFAVDEGLNQLQVFFDTQAYDFSIVIDLEEQEFYQSTQKFLFNGAWIDRDISCTMPCAGGTSISSYQLNGGGVNAIVTAMCSIEKFINLNIPLFQYQLYYSIGREFMKERIASDRINQYTNISLDRAEQLLTAYEKDYVNSLDALRAINQIREDYQCFQCRSAVSSKTLLP